MTKIHNYRLAIPINAINRGAINGNPWEAERRNAQPARHKEVHRTHWEVCPSLRLKSNWDKYWSCWLLTQTIVVMGTVQLNYLLLCQTRFCAKKSDFSTIHSVLLSPWNHFPQPQQRLFQGLLVQIDDPTRFLASFELSLCRWFIT